MIASIAAPFTFLEKPVKTLLFDAVKLAYMPLGLVPEMLDAVDVSLPICAQFRVINPHVMKVRDIERTICLECIQIDDAVRPDFFFDDRQQCLCSGVCDNRGIDLPAPLSQAKNRDFTSSAASAFSLALAAEVACVGFDRAG